MDKKKGEEWKHNSIIAMLFTPAVCIKPKWKMLILLCTNILTPLK
jgi:hypothetical protein